MDVPVVLEQVGDHAFRASVYAPAQLVAEAPTRQQAVDQIRSMIRQKLSQVEVIHVEVPAGDATGNPWDGIAGSWKAHPDAADFVQNLNEYRREVEQDPRRL